MRPKSFFLFAASALVVTAAFVASPAISQSKTVTYKEIKPILDRSCINCHGAKKQQDGVRLDSYEAIVKSKQGKLFKAGKPAESDLLLYVNGKKKPQMPMMAKPLPANEIQMISDWIAQGAKER